MTPESTVRPVREMTWKCSSSPAISGRTLFIGSDDQRLYALDTGSIGTGGAWPQYRQNARRTGRAGVLEVEAERVVEWDGVETTSRPVEDM